ncbi:MAG TPA: Sec-independent protein translocase protein TatB [Gallionella sp.]|nr:Sec-independent protein translocase protein TatB [Gallionella sp.]
MFDFSLSELMVIMVVALVVIGPERLPKVARTMGHLWGRAQRYVNGVKADIERDMAVEEFRQLQQKVQAEASAVEQSVKQAALTADQQVQQINEAVAKLSSSERTAPDQATQPGQATQLPAQPVARPSAIPPANKSA